MKHAFFVVALAATPALGDSVKGTFLEQMQGLMPDSVTLAPELVKTINWMDEQGWAHSYTDEDGTHWYLPIYPPEQFENPNISYVSFRTSGIPYTGHWSTPQTDVDNRVVEIASTSGDGGRAAIWVDGEGAQWFVHLGHDTVGIIGKDPLVLLQFLAMGYQEPGALEATDITPLEQAMYHEGVETAAALEQDAGLPFAPAAFQGFLNAEFGITLPKTARDLGIADFTYYGDENSRDPFVQWLISVTPPPSEEDLAYIQELVEMAEGMDLSEFGLEDPDKPQSFFDKIKGLFGSNK